ncbi:MAG: hypothetical protein ACXAB2_15950, partial [Candidatus Hodarchaeales archaeon]
DHKQGLYLPKFQEDLLEKTIIQRIYEYIDSRFPAWRTGIERSLKKQGFDLNQRGTFSFNKFPVEPIEKVDPKKIKFKVVILDQSPILHEVGDTYWKTYAAVARHIVNARNNKKFVTFTLADAENGGFSPSHNEDYFFRTEQSPQSITSVCAYALQNKKVQELMGNNDQIWMKKSEIIGGNHKFGLISTNPDVRIKTVEGDGGIVAQVKWIKDSMQHRKEVVRDLVNTLGFGNSGINMWVLRSGTKVGGQNIEESAHIIVIGRWIDEPTGLRRFGEAVAGISMLLLNRTGIYDTWAKTLPKNFAILNKSSIVKRLFEQLNNNFAWRSGWSMNMSVSKKSIEKWLNWGIKGFSEGWDQEIHFYNCILKKVVSKSFNKSSELI